MKAKAQGILRHQFWGTYSATVGLVFDSEAEASATLRVLGEPWERSEKNAMVLIACVESEALNRLKQRLLGLGAVEVDCGGAFGCESHCRDAEIDSVAHSVDYGPGWSFEIEVPDPNQGDLFGVTP